MSKWWVCPVTSGVVCYRVSILQDYSTSSAEAIGVPPPTSTTGPSAGSLAQRHGVLVGQKVCGRVNIVALTADSNV